MLLFNADGSWSRPRLTEVPAPPAERDGAGAAEGVGRAHEPATKGADSVSDQEAEVQAEPELDPETGGEVEEPEPEPDDDTTEPEGEPEEDTEPSSLTVAMEKEQNWDRVRRYLSKNFAEIEGDDADHYAECPYCNATGTPGYMALGPIPDELHGLTYQLLSMRPPADLKKDPYTLQCATCGGEAETQTGSKRAGQETIPCLDCQGKGWVATGPERAGGLMAVSNGPTPAYTPPADTSEPMFVPPANEPPEVADLRKQGYVIVAPMHAA